MHVVLYSPNLQCSISYLPLRISSTIFSARASKFQQRGGQQAPESNKTEMRIGNQRMRLMR